MKVLLINPMINQAETLGRLKRFMTPMPSIGLAYIAAVLEKNGVKVEIVDDFFSRMGIGGITERVKNEKPDIVGVSCITPTAYQVFEIARRIKVYKKDTIVVLGNVHASIFAEPILKEEYVDVIVHGEGEYTMLELVKAIEGGKNLRGVEGISFLEDGTVIHTPTRPPIENLDGLPFPAWHLYPHSKFRILPFVEMKRPALVISGSRGCPYKCSFCVKVMKGLRRARSAKNIVDEFEWLIENFGIKQVAFVDPIFPFGKKEGLEFCEEIISRGVNKKVIWATDTRVDLVDKELLQKMKEAGCKRIMYGFETGTQTVLDGLVKKFTLEDAKKAAEETKKAGIQSVGFFMLGMAGETKETAQRTIEFARELNIDFAKFTVTVPYPGTELYETLLREGKLNTDDWSKFTPYTQDPESLVYVPDGMSGEELLAMQKKAFFGFYMRPKMIFRHLFKIRTVKLQDLLYGAYTLLSS